MNFTHKVWAKINTLAVPKNTRPSDKGAGFLEYAAILVIIAVIATAVYNLKIHEDIRDAIGDSIDKALNFPTSEQAPEAQ